MDFDKKEFLWDRGESEETDADHDRSGLQCCRYKTRCRKDDPDQRDRKDTGNGNDG